MKRSWVFSKRQDSPQPATFVLLDPENKKPFLKRHDDLQNQRTAQLADPALLSPLVGIEGGERAASSLSDAFDITIEPPTASNANSAQESPTSAYPSPSWNIVPLPTQTNSHPTSVDEWRKSTEVTTVDQIGDINPNDVSQSPRSGPNPSPAFGYSGPYAPYTPFVPSISDYFPGTGPGPANVPLPPQQFLPMSDGDPVNTTSGNEEPLVNQSNTTSSESFKSLPEENVSQSQALQGPVTTSMDTQYRLLHSALQSDWFSELLTARIHDVQSKDTSSSTVDDEINETDLKLVDPENRPGEIYTDPLTWNLNLYAGTLACTLRRRNLERKSRGSLRVNMDWHRKASMIHELLEASFASLTRNFVSHSRIVKQATTCLSTFCEVNAIWDIVVSNLSPSEKEGLRWGQPMLHDARPVARFIRFRFPEVHFEWSFDASSFPLSALDEESQQQTVEIEFQWRAVARSGFVYRPDQRPIGSVPQVMTNNNDSVYQHRFPPGFVPQVMTNNDGSVVDLTTGKVISTPSLAASSPWNPAPREPTLRAFPAIVAYGKCKDALTVTVEGYLVILRREFTIDRILKPELMIPVPYPESSSLQSLNHPRHKSDRKWHYTIRKWADDWLFVLVGFGAFLMSIRPVADIYGPAIGWWTAVIGFLAATIPLISMALG